MRLLMFAASHREASLNRKLAACCLSIFEGMGLSPEHPPYDAFDLPLFNDAERLAGRIPAVLEPIRRRFLSADGVVIVSPEYNGSMPGSLKNLIDWLSHYAPPPLAGKPVLLLCASTSKRGGIVGLTHLRQSLESLNAYTFPRLFTLGEANMAFDADGRLPEPVMQKLGALIGEYIAYCRRLTG